GSASHSAWLTFMYPRLLLARDLLSEDGVIFISIDDNEQANLKMLCDSIFGEENFISTFPRITKRGGKSSDIIALNHDYVLMYSFSDSPKLFPVKHNDDAFKYKDKFFEQRGFYKLNQTLDYDSLQYSKSLDYPIEIDNEIFYPGSSEELFRERQNGIHNTADWAWRWSKEKFQFGLKNDFIVVKGSKNGKRIYTKTYQKAFIEENDNGYYIEYGDRTKSLSTLETTENIYSNDNGTKDLEQTIGKKMFEHAKPLALIEKLLQLSVKDNDIILDFFSGSGTTAQAVMELNAQDNGARKFIMVQWQEETKENSTARKEGYATIDQIGMERIRRAAEKIRKEHPDTTADLGFKHYTLREPDNDLLAQLEEFTPDTVLAEEPDHILKQFGVPTVITTWLLRDGYGFNAPVQQLDLAGYEAWLCNKHLYLIGEGFSIEAMKALYEKYDTDDSFAVENIIIFGYSFTWTEAQMIKNNLFKIKADDNINRLVNLEIRY
ncbi:MAG: hypothetical protein J6E49_06990, partial [Acidaminococcaceae bacterium]|nr:hypothetical protein [Acidaminococcaceae bacterium]